MINAKMRTAGPAAIASQASRRHKPAGGSKTKKSPLPDALWKVFGDLANPWMLGVMVVGFIVTVAGPWAIIRFVSRQTKATLRD